MALLAVAASALAVAACRDGGSTPETHPLPPGLEQVMGQVAGIRGLPAAPGVEVGTVRPEDVRGLLQDTLSEQDKHAFAEMTVLYRLIGVIGPGDDVEDLYLEFAARAVIGFYEPADDDFWLVDGATPLDFDSFDATLRATVAHEFVHALQDERFDLPSLLGRAAGDLDWSLGLSAVLEGDATHHERLWAVQYLPGSPVGGTSGRTISGGSIPAALEREFRFPYESGLDWARLVGALNANAATEAVLGGRRITTAEILHPQLASAGWQPVAVELPDLTKAAGVDWTRESEGSFGEFRLRNFLQLQLEGLPAVRAAEGWAGDRYQFYRDGNHSVAVIRVAFASARDGAEFTGAMAAWFEASGGDVRGEGRTTAVFADGRTVSYRAAGDSVILVFGSNPEIAAKAAALLGTV